MGETRRRVIVAECAELEAGAHRLQRRIALGRYAGHDAGSHSGFAVCALLETVARDGTDTARRLRHDALHVVRWQDGDDPGDEDTA